MPVRPPLDVDLVGVLEATGLVAKARFTPQPDAGPDPSAAQIGKRDVWMPEASGAGTSFAAPLINGTSRLTMSLDLPQYNVLFATANSTVSLFGSPQA